MKLTMKCALLALGLLLLGAGPSFAIPASYGDATHQTAYWQDLGTWRGDSGVAWSINNSGWGHDTSLEVGDTIKFVFAMHKDHYGTHYADFLKAWVDWGQDGSFDANDVVAFGKQELEGYGRDAWSNDTYFFYSTTYDITNAMAGNDLYLRARVTCSESLGSQDPGFDYYAAFAANDKAQGKVLYQGESEDWTLTVAATPLPPSVLLLGSGLIGFVGIMRKRLGMA